VVGANIGEFVLKRSEEITKPKPITRKITKKIYESSSVRFQHDQRQLKEKKDLHFFRPI